MSNVVNIDDHRCFYCTCGSSDFLLLLSGKIQCSCCHLVHEVEWCTSEYLTTLDNHVTFMENKISELETHICDLVCDYDRLENSLDSYDDL